MSEYGQTRCCKALSTDLHLCIYANAAFGNLSENPSQISAEKQHIDRRYTFVCHGVGFFKSRRSIFGGTRCTLCGASQFWRPSVDETENYVLAGAL
jgi:hypothetical protein